jgi:S-DNA-T family DNA segregation ATPase FtsK/SpoIIIE
MYRRFVTAWSRTVRTTPSSPDIANVTTTARAGGSMTERGPWHRHAVGLALAFAWLFLAIALVGYNPADPPGRAVWSDAPRSATNPCGPVGAALAHGLFASVGWASLTGLWALGVLAVLKLRHRPAHLTAWHLGGFALTTATTACLLATVETWADRVLIARSPTSGCGGLVGALGSTFLTSQFGSFGSLLILAALLATGLALCNEWLVVWPYHEIREAFGPRRRRSPTVAPDPWSSLAAAWDVPSTPALAGSSTPMPALAAFQPPAAAAVRRPASSPAAPDRRTLPSPAALEALRRVPADGTYVLPPPELLIAPNSSPVMEQEDLIQQRALVLEKTLREHGCLVRVVQIDTGPVITMFEIELEAGLRVSKVIGLANDLAIALAVPSVRIVYPLPGRTTVGVEVPNESRTVVRLSEVIMETIGDATGMSIPLFLGKDVKGVPITHDLAKMPHLLIAGRTGTGKSVCLNALIVSILMTRRPDEVKLILIDPKKVELSQFKRIPHLMYPVVTEMEKVESLLTWACEKMDERYSLLERARVRSIRDYNALGEAELRNRLHLDEEEEAEVPLYLPSIVIAVDELADMVQSTSKEVEVALIRLAQKARAAGIHLILATQRPTVDVVTGLIKTNMPGRIAFQVTSRNDSRIVLDDMGAEKLLGNGDMLFLKPNTSDLVRAQGTYVSDEEVDRICTYLERYKVEYSKELMQSKVAKGKDANALRERDEMYEAAIDVIVREGRGSCSLLQRALGIGYGRAARLIDYMAEDGIVGEYKSGKFRDVLYTWDEWEALKNGGSPPGGEAAA